MLVGGRNLSLNSNLVSLTLAAHQQLSVFIPEREKNENQGVNEMSGEESAKLVKMPKKNIAPGRERIKSSPEMAYGWQSLLITKERGKKIFSYPTIQSDPFLATTLKG